MKPTLQFKYSTKQLRYSLLFGLLWILIFVFYSIFRSESFFGYAYLAMGIIFIGTYFYKKIFHYAVIKDNVLIKKDIIPKRIKLDEITDIHYFSGKYKLVTKTSEMTINTMLIDKTAIKDLKKLTTQINLSKL